MKQLKVFLADLRHNHNSILTSDAMPLGIGYMKSYMDAALPDVSSTLFVYPNDLEREIKREAPDVLMLTNYMWNDALSHHFAKHAKRLNPECLVVMGGPNIPVEDERKMEYVRQNPNIDIYVNGEGDFLASQIVELFENNSRSIVDTLKEDIPSSTYRRDGELIVTPLVPRTKDLNDIPSPWLNGVMDKFFDGKLVPLYETNRGCPFSCTFCVNGAQWYNKVMYFDLDRVREEIYYIAEKISTSFPEQKMLKIADLNFGMFKRDVDIAAFLGETQIKYKYPLIIDATTGKNRPDNIIAAMEKVNGALILYQAVQSLNTEVLENIKRSNISLEAYEELQVHIKGRGMRSSSDLILGLPGESKQTHFTALEQLVNAGTSKLNNFQAMMLKGSELESLKSRDTYDFKTKYRLLPKCYGIYFEEKVFDYEEIIVASNTMSFEDYLQARQIHLTLNLYWNDARFAPLIDLMRNMKIDSWEWVVKVNELVSRDDAVSREFYDGFLKDTLDELFDSRDETTEHFNIDENFSQLDKGAVGDNIIYKYRGTAFLHYWEELTSVAIQATRELAQDEKSAGEHLRSPEFWSDLGTYLTNSFTFLDDKNAFRSNTEFECSYNIEDWINAGSPLDIDPYFSEDKISVQFVHSKENSDLLNEVLTMWNLEASSYSMLIRRISLDWLKCDIQTRAEVLEKVNS